jgi:hypothetical protein
MDNTNTTLDSNDTSCLNLENTNENTSIREPKRYKIKSKTDFISTNHIKNQDEEKKVNWSYNSNNSENDNNEFTTIGMSIQER